MRDLLSSRSMPPRRASAIAVLAWAFPALLLATSASHLSLPAATARSIARFASPMVDGATRPIGQVGGVTRVIVPDGDRLWLGVGPRVVAVDFEDPASPRIIGQSTWLPDVVTDLAVEGGIAVAAAGGPELYTLDVRDPSAPRVAGWVTLTETTGAVALRGGFAYALHQTRSGGFWSPIIRSNVAVVDVRNPAAPVVVRQALMPTGVFAVDLVIAGDVLAVSTTDEPNVPLRRRTTNALRLFTLDEPGAPRLAAIHQDPAWSMLATGGSPQIRPRVYGLGTRPRVSPTSSDELTVAALDVRDPTRPVVGTRYGLYRVSNADALAVMDDGQPYITTIVPFTTGVVLRPQPLPLAEDDGEQWRLQTVGALLGLPSGGLAASGPYLIAAELGGRINVLDPRRPPDPNGRLGSLTVGRLDTIGEVESVTVSKGAVSDRLLATSYTGGVMAFDLASPTEPRLLGVAYDGSYHKDVSAEDGVAVVWYAGAADFSTTRFDIYDLQEQGAPLHRSVLREGMLDMVQQGRRLYTRAYAAASPGGSRHDQLQVFDLADPSHPVLRSSQPLTDWVDDMDAEGAILALVGSVYEELPGDRELFRTRLHVYDLGEPSAPRFASTVELASSEGEWGAYPSVQVAGGYAFVAASVATDPEDERFKLFVIDISDPSRPRPVAEWPSNQPIAIERVEDGHAFVRSACNQIWSPPCGIEILDVRDPATPTHRAWLGDGPYDQLGDPAQPPYHTAVRGGLIYATHGDAGIYIYRPPLDWPPDAGAPPLTTLFLPRVSIGD